MAVLGKIRGRGPILIGIIGLGLFAFIAEEAFRSCEATQNDKRQQVVKFWVRKLAFKNFRKW